MDSNFRHFAQSVIKEEQQIRVVKVRGTVVACIPWWGHRAGIMAGYVLGDQKQEEKVVHKDDWF